MAPQRSDGDVQEVRITLPIALCARHRRDPAGVILANPRAQAVIDLELLRKGRSPIDWSLVRIEFARVH